MQNVLRRARVKGRVSPATVIASVALFFSLGGVGMAASGYRITSLFQIAPRVRHELRGARGPAGPRGPVGPQGATGVRGPVGAQGVAGPQGDVAQVSSLTFSSDQETIGAQQQGSFRDVCPPGELATSGGYQADQGLQVLANQPVTQDQGLPYPRPVGWMVTVYNPTSGTLGVTVKANCAP